MTNKLMQAISSVWPTLRSQVSPSTQPTQSNHASPESNIKKEKIRRWAVLAIMIGSFLLVAASIIIASVALADSRKVPVGQTVSAVANNSKTKPVCTTPECVRIAASVLNNIDATVDPCDNFYDYACGQWINNNPIPYQLESVSQFTLLRQRNSRALQDLIVKLGKKGVSSDLSIGKAVRMYETCINDSNIDSSEAKAALSGLFSSLGFPALYTNISMVDHSTSNLSDFLVAYYSIGVPSIWNLGVSYNYTDYDRYSLWLSEAKGFFQNRDVYTKPERADLLKSYRQYAKDMFCELSRWLGVGNISDAQFKTRIEAEVERMIDFETAIVSISTPTSKTRNRDSMFFVGTLPELNITNEWHNFFVEVLFGAGVIINCDEEPIQTMAGPGYFSELQYLLAMTDPAIIMNYVTWRFISSMVIALPDRFQQIEGMFNRVAYGITSTRPRDDTCIRKVTEMFEVAFSRLYVENLFTDTSKMEVAKLVEQVVDAFKTQLLPEATWMDANTTASARKKADTVTAKVGYSENLKNDAYIESIYADMVVADTFIGSVMAYSAYKTRSALSLLRQLANSDDWGVPAHTVNAFYHHLAVQMTIPAGIIQPPFYYANAPKVMNFGSIGMVIGHEISHGFDDTGRRFDYAGRMENWWSNQSLAHFNAKVNCIISQYNNYCIPEDPKLCMRGQVTRGDDIADNGGLRASLYAYRQAKSKSNDDVSLPGLNFTDEQLFYVTFAHMWCGAVRLNSLRANIATNSHTIGRFRVIGTLQNMPEFAETFKCAKGSYMNPEKRCRVW